MDEAQLVLDKFLVIGFGSAITILLGVIGYFLKQSNEEVKVMLSKINDHETRITVSEKDIERHEANIGTMNTKLADEIVSKLRAISPR